MRLLLPVKNLVFAAVMSALEQVAILSTVVPVETNALMDRVVSQANVFRPARMKTRFVVQANVPLH